MIKLDYRTNNPRWGLSGVVFRDWQSYCLTLGFLSNINHYENRGINVGSIWDSSVSVHIEQNHRQGAWDSEGRIHYYNYLHDLRTNLCDLYTCRSAGVGRIKCRINSNGYIQSLIYDFNFQVITYAGYHTADIIPPTNVYGVRETIQDFLLANFSDSETEDLLSYFERGFNM